MKVKRDWHRDFFKNSFYNPASPLAVKKAVGEAGFIAKASLFLGGYNGKTG